ncbi:MAG: outer membrane lipoprotein-sorting protein [Gemmatimonadetes bacterium]|nr:outer membrane lipoprotein-sorting protein [Gemmatimonadota bacterium]
MKILQMIYRLFLVVLFAYPVVPLASERDVESIVRKIDELYRSKASVADMEMQIVTPHWERTLSLRIWTKGMDKTFIRIDAPKKEKGVTTLRIGNEMWNYLPKTNKVIKVPPSMMMGSWMGSDFTNDDLVKESSMLNDYIYDLIVPDDAQPGHLYIRFVPKEDSPIVWGKLITAVRADDLIPVWQHFYDEKGNLMRILNFKEIVSFGGKTIPSLMEMVPQNKDRHKTVMRYLRAEFDVQIGDDVFTRRNLQRK